MVKNARILVAWRENKYNEKTETLETRDSADWYLYNKDVRESASSLVDGDGNLAAAYLYDPFGNTETLANENFENEIRYTGQIYDQSTGLYYYNARYYDPEDGRFLSQDTYRGENMEPETLHLYAYCANNPVNYVDENGHKAKRFRTKNENLGWGVTIQASVGQLIASASVGLEVVWFNSNVDKRYEQKQSHVFWRIDSDISAGLSKSFKAMLKKKKTKIYSLAGLKEIKKSLKKNARFNGALSAIYFRIYAKKDQFNNYLDFAGPSSNASFSLGHFTANVGWSNKCRTTGIGITTSNASAAGGTSDYYFSKSLTKSFRGVFSSSKVKRNAQK